LPPVITGGDWAASVAQSILPIKLLLCILFPWLLAKRVVSSFWFACTGLMHVNFLFYIFASFAVVSSQSAGHQYGAKCMHEKQNSLSGGRLTNDFLRGQGADNWTMAQVGVHSEVLSQVSGSVILGSDEADVMLGLAGDDIMIAGDGIDVVDSGDGQDRLYGGPADDLLDGGAGDDGLWGGDGNDFVHGGSGNDLLDGGLGDDTLTGSQGNDYLQGGEGEDRLCGGLGDDVLDGGAGSDFLNGHHGRDTFLFHYVQQPGDAPVDWVKDFTWGEDKLEITGYAWREMSLEQQLQQLSLHQDGTNSVLQLKGGDGLVMQTVILQNSQLLSAGQESRSSHDALLYMIEHGALQL
jgi:Ca2+-binding RTX toxin-like protein